jgi:hypothetical protein
MPSKTTKQPEKRTITKTRGNYKKLTTKALFKKTKTKEMIVSEIQISSRPPSTNKHHAIDKTDTRKETCKGGGEETPEKNRKKQDIECKKRQKKLTSSKKDVLAPSLQNW